MDGCTGCRMGGWLHWLQDGWIDGCTGCRMAKWLNECLMSRDGDELGIFNHTHHTTPGTLILHEARTIQKPVNT